MHDVILVFAALGDLLDGLASSHGALAYGLMLLVLVLGTCGVPVPEEAVFATAGALAAAGRISWALGWFAGWLAIVLLDTALHAVGRWSGPGIRRSRLGRRVGTARWNALQAFVERKGIWAVVAARFVMGTRIPVFLLAGAMGMPRRRFVAVVSVAASVSVALPLALGFFLARNLPALLAGLHTGRWLLLGAVACALAALWLRARRRRPAGP